MVKADFSRDYYGDLDLPSTADMETIKKQYRRLGMLPFPRAAYATSVLTYSLTALKYHPDRNPGKEIEFSEKFQTIQSAHEVLTNAEQKVKYDNFRRNRSTTSTASGVRGNPWQNAGKQWPAPPKPPAYSKPPTQPKPAAQAKPSSYPPKPPRPPMQKQHTASGADKYAGFTKEVPPTSPKYARKAPETSKAWEDMKSGPKKASFGTSAADSNNKPSGPPKVPPRATPQAQPKGSFGNRVNRGYTPRSPGADDPPVTNKNYFTTRTHSNLFNETSAAARARMASAPAFDPDPASGFRDSSFPDMRQSTPYQTSGGEKFNPFEGSNVSQTGNTRESSPTPSQRQRSASVPDESDNVFKAKRNGHRPQTEGSADQDYFTSNPQDRSRSHQNGTSTGGPFTAPNSSSSSLNGGEGQHSLNADEPRHRTNTHAANYGGEPGSNEQGNVYATPQKFSKSSPLAPDGSHGTRYTTGRAGGAFSEQRFFGRKRLNLPPELSDHIAHMASSGDSAPSCNGLNFFESKLRHIVGGLAVNHSPYNASSSQQSAKAPYTSQSQSDSQRNTSTNAEHVNSFNFQFRNDNFTPDPHRFTRSSADNINTKFVADEDGASSWQFNAGSPVTETDRPNLPPRSKSGTRVGRKSPYRAQSKQASFVDLTEDETTAAPGAFTAEPSAFNPEEWSEKIGPQTFEPPLPQKATASPTRPARPIRQLSKKSVRMTMGTAGLVDSDESSGQDDLPQQAPPTTHVGDQNGPAGTESPGAMDIDSPPAKPGMNGVRNIPVEPSRPEWRAGDVNGIKPDAVPQQPGFVPFAGGSEDTEEFKASFAEFRNVEPFAEHATGLGSFGDMKSTLPFPSRASVQVPIKKEKPKPVKLNLPDPPRPPHPPAALAVASLKPSAATWQKYVGEFYMYLAEWHVYNTKFTDHFQARGLEVQKKLNGPNWLESRDDSGMHEYLHWAEEDREVRAKWTDACNEHESQLREFAAYRVKMK